MVYGGVTDEVVEEKPRVKEMGMPPPPQQTATANDLVFFDNSDSVPKLHTTESSCSDHVASPGFTSEVQSEPKWKDWSSAATANDNNTLDFGFNYLDATVDNNAFGGGSNQMFPLQDMFMYMQKPY